MHWKFMVDFRGKCFLSFNNVSRNSAIRLCATMTQRKAFSVAHIDSRQNPLIPYSAFNSLIRFSHSALWLYIRQIIAQCVITFESRLTPYACQEPFGQTIPAVAEGKYGHYPPSRTCEKIDYRYSGWE